MKSFALPLNLFKLAYFSSIVKMILAYFFFYLIITLLKATGGLTPRCRMIFRGVNERFLHENTAAID